MSKKFIATFIALIFSGIAGCAVFLIMLSSSLPQIVSLEDYEPLLVSDIFDREEKKIGEFSRGEQRKLIKYKDIPEVVTQAFVAAEDASFFKHNGINFASIARALIANIKAGRKVQGGSTITQQVAKTLMLTNKKTYARKLKEALLAYRMENHLSKEDILYLYLNQIYLGQGTYGVAKACEIYFRKPLSEISLAEAALLAGLTPAPSRYTPAYQPKAAKNRQKYVLSRMVIENYITEEQAQQAADLPIQIFIRQNDKGPAPHYLETVRQILVKHIGEEQILDKGLKIYTSLDIEKQKEAQRQVEFGLRSLDKRQGFRGAKKNLVTPEEVNEFLLKSRNQLTNKARPVRQLHPDGTFPKKDPLNLTGKDVDGDDLPNIPDYLTIGQIINGVVTNVDDEWGLITVRFAENRGLIDVKTMEWARKPNPKIKWLYDKIERPSQVLQTGDVIEIRLKGEIFRSARIDKKLSDLKSEFQKKKEKYKRPEDLPNFDLFADIELEQEPISEAALISIDQKTSDILAMIGGYDFKRSKFNRTYQARRQTGSSFKTFVYAAALDHGYTAVTPIIDAPIIFEEEDKNSEVDESEETTVEKTKKWKPKNHSKKFMGDILFRNALIRSFNVPTVKIIEQIGVSQPANYARRLGVSSSLNMDYTLALGSSSVTLYEMTKAFAHIANLGKRMKPIVIHRVVDKNGNILVKNLSLDDRFEEEIQIIEEKFEKHRQDYLAFKKKNGSLKTPHFMETDDLNDDELGDLDDLEDLDDLDKIPNNKQTDEKTSLADSPKESPLFFKDPDQLIKPSTAYIITNLLQGAIEEPRATGGKARALGRPVAGKTGSTSGYFDGWFIGYTPDITTGVWVGYDEERSLGRGEVGGNNALPIWLEYMKFAHKDLPPRSFEVPDGIIFANIDNKTGQLASAQSETIVRQAFSEGTEPNVLSDDESAERENDLDFLKEDLTDEK